MKNFILLSCLTVFVACTDFSSEVMDITHTKTIPIEEALSSLEDFLYTSEIKTKSVIDKISGYEVTKKIGCANADIRRITQQIVDERKPVYMRGQMKDIVTGEQKGHAWVIDGVNGDMFHINWGWHGDSDGYYSKGVFNTADLMSYDSSDPGISNMSADFYHYFRYLLY